MCCRCDGQSQDQRKLVGYPKIPLGTKSLTCSAVEVMLGRLELVSLGGGAW